MSLLLNDTSFIKCLFSIPMVRHMSRAITDLIASLVLLGSWVWCKRACSWFYGHETAFAGPSLRSERYL